MIYTVTLNPAIDVSLHVRDGLMPGKINRSYGMRTDPGGKGINVSKTLRVLGMDSVVCTCVCGEDGRKLAEMLSNEFELLSVNCPSGNTRTNIKITGADGVTTDINGDGPAYDKDTVESLKALLSGRLASGDVVVISGSPPSGSPAGIYADLIKSFGAVEGVRVILDCSGTYLREGLEAHPYAVKPNCSELGIGVDPEAAMNEALDIVSGGVSRCLVSMGSAGAVFADSEREKFYSKAVEVDVKCTTGCGDAMTAGLAYALEKGMSSEETFRFCMALASAKAGTDGTAPPPKELVFELFKGIPFCGQ